jgi:hypothetical protein
MTQPSRVIYLPPGVVPGPTAQPQQPGPPQVIPSGIPFDRAFFENVLPGSVASFSQQVECEHPLVQVLTVDGAVHYVKGLSGVSDSWVALHTQTPDTDSAVQMFVPYQTIFRVSIHPCEEHNRQLGFVLKPPKMEVTEGKKAAKEKLAAPAQAESQG